MRILIRVLALLLVALTIAGPAIGPAALAEPRPLLAGPALNEPPDEVDTTGNPGDPDASRLLYGPLGIPTFSWQDMGASKYELEVATTPDFGDSVIVRRSNLPYTTYTPSGFDEISGTPGFGLNEDPTTHDVVDEATFYWRVRAYDDVNKQWGHFSSSRRFTRHWGYRPVPVAPADGATVTITPRFEWEPVPGASFYQIQIDTSSSFGSTFINAATDVAHYTPSDALPNDDDIFWRVRAFHRPNTGSFTGGRGGEWSATQVFKLAWSANVGWEDGRPQPLTPPDGANYTGRPLFCWRPVPGADKYRIDVASHPGFVAGSIVVDGRNSSGQTEGSCYSFPRDSIYKLERGTSYYWRVTAVNAKGHLGQRSDEGAGGAPFMFTTADTEPPIVPDLLYPPYYYPQLMEHTFEDRTVAVPTFIWDHVPGASTYQLCIDDDVDMDCTSPSSIVVETENTSYTFADTAAYPLQDGQTYYWKVRADVNPAWDELNTKWFTRIDRTLIDETGPAIGDLELLLPTYRPTSQTQGQYYGQESLTYYPVFAWRPTAPIGGAVYEIEIATDPGFDPATRVHLARTDFPEYTPAERPAPGTYFWRVRQVDPDGDWTGAARFIVSRNFTVFSKEPLDGSPDSWQAMSVPLYAPGEEATDIADDGNLTGLYLGSDSYDWYLGLELRTAITVGVLIDTDHVDGSGADTSPPGRPDPVSPDAHRPEYALYWSTAKPAGEVWRWNGSAWVSQGALSSISASAAYSDTSQFLEIKVPVTQLGMPGSLGVMLYTFGADGAVLDRLPNRPDATDVGTYLTESTTPTPLLPADLPPGFDASASPSYWSLLQVERSTPALRWRAQDPLQPLIEATLFFETFMDDTFSTYYQSENANAPKFSASNKTFYDSNNHWAPQVHYSDNDSYHWRVKRSGFGPSAANHFVKQSYVPYGPEVNVPGLSSADAITSTPAFSWQAVQAAPEYYWELYEGGTRKDYATVMMPYFTPRKAIKDGTYSWKVWPKDARGRLGSVAAQDTFVKISDTVGVREGWSDFYDEAAFAEGRMVFAWSPISTAAYYKVTIAADENFSRLVNTYSTHNTVFSPDAKPRAAGEPVIYVRVVMCDNKNNEGPPQHFELALPSLYLPCITR